MSFREIWQESRASGIAPALLWQGARVAQKMGVRSKDWDTPLTAAAEAEICRAFGWTDLMAPPDEGGA